MSELRTALAIIALIASSRATPIPSPECASGCPSPCTTDVPPSASSCASPCEPPCGSTYISRLALAQMPSSSISQPSFWSHLLRQPYQTYSAIQPYRSSLSCGATQSYSPFTFYSVPKPCCSPLTYSTSQSYYPSITNSAPQSYYPSITSSAPQSYSSPMPYCAPQPYCAPVPYSAPQTLYAPSSVVAPQLGCSSGYFSGSSGMPPCGYGTRSSCGTASVSGGVPVCSS